MTTSFIIIGLHFCIFIGNYLTDGQGPVDVELCNLEGRDSGDKIILIIDNHVIVIAKKFVDFINKIMISSFKRGE